MQAFVSSLTAAVLFIHTVCGCCWHHAHAGEHGQGVGKAAKCCHHHEHNSDRSQPAQPGKCKTDCEGTCSYVVPHKVQIEAPQWVPMDLAAVLPTLADYPLEAASFWQAASLPLDLAPPLRTHLLHQVLLN